MVMTRQPPLPITRPRKNPMEDEWRGARSPPDSRRRAAPVTTAAAAKQSDEPALSLYEELVRYHREHPQHEDQLKEEVEQRARATGGGDGEDDRKPPARRPAYHEASSTVSRKPNKGTYRVPVNREYFAAKETSPSPTTSTAPKARMSRDELHQLSIPHWAEGDGPTRPYNNAMRCQSYPTKFPDDTTPLPFADLTFHDSAEDEALARQLQAEEEERVAALRHSTGSMPRRTAVYSTPVKHHKASYPGDSDEALARRLAGLTVEAPGMLFSTPTKMTPTSRSHEHHSPHAKMADDILKQEKILREIAQENERKQLEWALKESKKAARLAGLTPPHRPQSHYGPDITDLSWQTPSSPARQPGSSTRQADLEWEASQDRALEEYERQQGVQREAFQRHPFRARGHMDLPSLSPVPPPHFERTRSSVQRGQQETVTAIRSGQARIVRCQGCAGRLQAPVQYSMVYCPKCGHVSPLL